MEPKIILPYAPVLVESTRSIGYSFEAALSDIIDNSISKSAQNINILFSSVSPQYLAVIDDGEGMDAKELESAMRYGSKSSLDERDKKDLGRFGLGLKTASLSQCRKMTVITKKENELHAASWDLDYIIKEDNWAAIWYSLEEIKRLSVYEYIKDIPSGTIVLWESFDRIIQGSQNAQKVFDEKIERAREHVALVFHRFMDTDRINNHVNIFFNHEKVTPIDPFLTDNPATQPLSEQVIRIDGNVIKVKPYILPFASKVSSKDKKKLGELSDLRQNQGFYIYRNSRLIIWGTWFRLIKFQELNKLARIRVDIPNTLDSIWEIDVKKSTASLPDVIKRNLVTIVENSVGRSERVYKYRGRRTSNDQMEHVWETIDNRGTFIYQINRNLPMYKALEAHLDDQGLTYLNSFVRTIEDSFPYGDVYYRLAKNENSYEKSGLEFEEAYGVALDTIASIKAVGGDIKQFINTMDKVDFFAKYPEVIEKIRKDYEND